MIWLGKRRGYLTDWVTQKWVQITGRRIKIDTADWLAGPTAPTTGITSDYFTQMAAVENLRLHHSDGTTGVMRDFAVLRGESFDPSCVSSSVAHFYERTSGYELDAWSEWSGVFRPFGWLLAVIFSRRLQQLNVPLSGLDTSKGLTNEVLRFVEPGSGLTRHTAWFRRLSGSGNVLYAGFYSACSVPGHPDPCVKVVFPLPNGNAIVFMRTECLTDGSFRLTSAGNRFGDPGFYFTVHSDTGGEIRARYVRSLRETIHVFPGENGLLRADHVIAYFGLTFLKLHYRMRWIPESSKTHG